MLTRELESQTLPYLHLTDKVYQALQLMNDNHVTHLPIVEADKYIGLISEEICCRQKMTMLNSRHCNSHLPTHPLKGTNISLKLFR